MIDITPFSCQEGGLSTGIEELDLLLRDGLVLPPSDEGQQGLVILIRGAAGTGKSTLALQLASNLAVFAQLSQVSLDPHTLSEGGSHQYLSNAADNWPCEAAGLFLSLEQDKSELATKLAAMNASWLRHAMRQAKRIQCPKTAGQPLNWPQMQNDLDHPLSFVIFAFLASAKTCRPGIRATTDKPSGVWTGSLLGAMARYLLMRQTILVEPVTPRAR